jgi:hypothetical protein
MAFLICHQVESSPKAWLHLSLTEDSRRDSTGSLEAVTVVRRPPFTVREEEFIKDFVAIDIATRQKLQAKIAETE